MERRRRDIITSLLPVPIVQQKGNPKRGGSLSLALLANRDKLGGLVNRAIDALPFPLHLPGYNYAGPGTHLERNLEMGVQPVNKLDKAAMYHDIAYSDSKNTRMHREADFKLENDAWN
ncbi:hypothetical protein V9T40_007013 [Parthenolecanium corni]|uniref:Phospholipase A2-like domain-containing protein n=1 Tax=Parthenolecanium corni TaxID=536013 RepID=A0AAN9TY13_9HEMI